MADMCSPDRLFVLRVLNFPETRVETETSMAMVRGVATIVIRIHCYKGEVLHFAQAELRHWRQTDLQEKLFLRF